MADIQKALDWMIMKRNAGMRYSMDLRMLDNFSDCSSAVLRALRYAGFPVPWIGNTESMFSWRGSLFTPITRADIRAGDVFISGVPGASSNEFGHTGFALNATQAIHSTGRVNGIAITSNADSAIRAYANAPVYWFRVVGSTAPSPSPEPSDEDLIYLDEEFVDHEYLQSIFGIKVETWEFDNVESQVDLKQKALDRMNTQLDSYHETTATVLELGLKFEDLDLLEMGNRHVIDTDGRLMANGSRRILRLHIDYLNPGESTVTFGAPYKILVDYLSERRL